MDCEHLSRGKAGQSSNEHVRIQRFSFTASDAMMELQVPGSSAGDTDQGYKLTTYLECLYLNIKPCCLNCYCYHEMPPGTALIKAKG